MRKHAAFWGALIVVGLVLATLFGCKVATTDHMYAKVCADTDTGERAPDDKCDRVSTSERYRWTYYGPQVWIDPVGKKLPKNGKLKEPSDSETLVRISEENGGTAISNEKE